MFDITIKRKQIEDQINKNKTQITNYKDSLAAKAQDKSQKDSWYNDQISKLEKENDLLQGAIDSGEYLKDPSNEILAKLTSIDEKLAELITVTSAKKK